MNAALEFICTFLAVPSDRFEVDYRTKSLYIARLKVRKGGVIHSRVDFKNRRQLIERWENGARIWIHPNFDAILENHSNQLRSNFKLEPEDLEYLVIDTRMPQ